MLIVVFLTCPAAALVGMIAGRRYWWLAASPPVLHGLLTLSFFWDTWLRSVCVASILVGGPLQRAILAPEGTTVPVSSVIALVGDADEPIPEELLVAPAAPTRPAQPAPGGRRQAGREGGGLGAREERWWLRARALPLRTRPRA